MVSKDFFACYVMRHCVRVDVEASLHEALFLTDISFARKTTRTSQLREHQLVMKPCPKINITTFELPLIRKAC